MEDFKKQYDLENYKKLEPISSYIGKGVIDKGDKKEVSSFLKNQIKVAFENTVMCARGNSPEDSYKYAERMAKMVISLIEKEL